jgi:uncharacterized protein involved in response to NO
MITAWPALSSAPYRLFFLAGALQALLTMLVWIALLAGRLLDHAPALPLPPGWLHGWLMFFGLFPFFVTGFTLTAVPNWLGERGVARAIYLRAFWPMAAGALLFYPALWLGSSVLVAAIALHWTGWALATLAATRLIMQSRHPGKRHFYMAIAVIVCGLLAEIVFAASLLQLDAPGYAIARSAALWLFLVPTFFSISHRVVPAFTRMALPDTQPYQPLWMLPAMTFACLGHFLLEVAALPGWLWLADLPLLAMAVLLSRRWNVRNIRHPLVGIHHLSFAWLSVALALYIAQSFGSMLLGMAARVVVAHAGGPIEFPRALRNAFLIYQAVPLLRILADLPGIPAAVAHLLFITAGLLWVVCWGVWLRRLLPLLARQATA